jgi:5-hydroxyisourate hydrolase-like protein (transthyretin family)
MLRHCLAKLVFALLLPVLLLGGQASASGFSGRVSVQGPAAAATPLQGVSVIVSQKNKTLAVSVSDSTGRYSISSLAVGTYTVQFVKDNFLPAALNNYYLTDNTNTVLNVGLTPTINASEHKDGSGPGHRIWDVRNGNPFTVTFTWTLANGKSSGMQTAPPGSSTFITTDPEASLKIYVNGYSMQPAGTTNVVPATTGSLTGTVTDVNGTALQGAGVAVLNANNATVATTTTAPDGTYSVAVLLPGTYTVNFSDSGYIPFSATGVQVTAGNTTTANASLQFITGRLNGAFHDFYSGSGIAGVSVTVTDFNNVVVSSVSSDGSGRFDAGNFAPGTYTLSYTVAGYPAGSGQAQVVTNTSTDLSIVLKPIIAPPGALAGTVTDHSNGSPLGGVAVSVVDNNNATIASGQTASDGTYSLSGVPMGTYSVTFSIAGYQNASLPATVVPLSTTTLNASLTPIPVATVTVLVVNGATGGRVPGAQVAITLADGTSANQVTDAFGSSSFGTLAVGVNASISATVLDADGNIVAFFSQAQPSGFQSGASTFTLVLEPGSISGVVYGTYNAQPLGGANVTAFDANGVVAGTAITALDGSYSVTGLSYGRYSVTFAEANYDSQTLQGIAVSNGADTSGVNAYLNIQNGSVSGLVIDTNGLPSTFANVTLRDLTGGYLNVVGVNRDGTYSFAGIPAGTYNIAAATKQAADIHSVTINGNANTVQNFQLHAGQGSLHISVVDDSGAPVPGAQVGVNNFFSGVGLTADANGNCSIGGLYTSTYTVSASAQGFVSGSTTANVVEPNATAVTVHLTRLIPQPGDVSGVVTDATTGAPIAGALVDYNDSVRLHGQVTTAADGSYTIPALDTNNNPYAFSFRAGGYAAQFVSKFNLVPGQTNTINAALVPLGTLSGVVTDASTGSPIAGAQVQIGTVDGQGTFSPYAGVTTDKTGAYTAGVPAGTYTLIFSANLHTTLTVSNVAVSSGGATTQNAALTGNGGVATVSINVVDSRSGAGIANVGVSISYANRTSASGVTDSRGNCSLANQPAGVGYTITVTDRASGRSSTTSSGSGWAVGPNTLTIRL